MGIDGNHSHSDHADSDFKEFKNFHTSKIFKGLFLVFGLILGIAFTAFVKNTMTEYFNNTLADGETKTDPAPGPREPASRSRPRAERPRSQIQRLPPHPVEIAAAPPVSAPRPAPRKAPVAPARVVERKVPRAAAPAPPVVASEPRPLPKLVNIAGLSYDRETFVTCPDDCTMILRSRSGRTMRVKLKKSRFLNSMDRDNTHIDIEGYVADDRLVRIESIKAYPRREAGATNPSGAMAAVEGEGETKVRKPARLEPEARRETAAAEGEPKSKASRSQTQNLKSRLEASTGRAVKPAASDEGGGSFQDRLKRSTR